MLIAHVHDSFRILGGKKATHIYVSFLFHVSLILLTFQGEQKNCVQILITSIVLRKIK